MNPVDPTGEHEFEAAHGLPEPLPAREKLIWQGAPQWRDLAVHVFHIRKLAWYFLALLVLQVVLGLYDGTPLADSAPRTLGFALLAGVALGLLALMAWLSAKTTVYTLTDKRLVMRVGIVLTLTFNLPLRRLSAAHALNRADGTQDIALELAGEDKIAYFHLWPHARPWHLARPQPMLRVLPVREQVSEMLLTAWQAQATPVTASAAMAPQASPAVAPSPVRQSGQLSHA
jgi:hypothetical protein